MYIQVLWSALTAYFSSWLPSVSSLQQDVSAPRAFDPYGVVVPYTHNGRTYRTLVTGVHAGSTDAIPRIKKLLQATDEAGSDVRPLVLECVGPYMLLDERAKILLSEHCTIVHLVYIDAASGTIVETMIPLV
jgi:hypothetical protein